MKLFVLVISLISTFSTPAMADESQADVPYIFRDCKSIDQSEVDWFNEELREHLYEKVGHDKESAAQAEDERTYELHDCGTYFSIGWNLKPGLGVLGYDYFYLLLVDIYSERGQARPIYESIKLFNY